MADLTKQALTENAATAVTYAAATSGGDTIAAFDVRDELIVKNGGGGAINVTISSHEDCDQGEDHDLVESVDAAAEVHFRLRPTRRWQNPTTKKLDIAYSGVTSVTVACLRHPR